MKALRPMRRRVNAPVIALAVLVLTTAALLTQFASAAPTKSDAAGVLVIDNVYNNRNMDPQRESSSSANIALHVMYDTLVTFKGTDYQKVLPSLAPRGRSRTTTSRSPSTSGRTSSSPTARR